MKRQWRYLKAFGAHKYLGQIINGYKITESSLLAGAHLKGVGSVLSYLSSNGKVVGKDAFGTSIEEYMKRFADYNLVEIIS